jgi:AraC-like DNA-binding protein
MVSFTFPASFTVAPHLCAQPDTRHRGAVADERDWRVLPSEAAVDLSASQVVATRWHAATDDTREVRAETAPDCHVVMVVLRNMNIRLSAGGRTVQDGVATPGMFHVTEPAVSVRCLFRGPYDALHLHIHNTLIAEVARDISGNWPGLLCSNGAPGKDPRIEWLARALVDANNVGGAFGRLYAKCISIAIVARLLGASCDGPKVAELVRWRLKRAIDYVESRLDEPLHLADMASAVGLSRMYFAAQFRAATGLRPHEYLLHRRIERAKQMLVDTDMSLVNVALSVGFQSQPHFQTVFKRLVGYSPNVWRQLHEHPARF